MTTQVTMTPRAWAMMGLLGLIWGWSFAATRMALTEMGFWTTVAWRIGGACVVLWVVVLALRYPLPRSLRTWGVLLSLGVIGNAIPFSLITWGQMSVPSGLAAILNAATALFGVLAAAAFFADEKLTLRKLAGVSTGILGVIVAMGLSTLAALDLAALGQLAIVLSAVAYALTGVLGRIALRQVAPQVAATGMMTGAALVMVPLALVLDGPPVWTHSAHVWMAMAYSSVIATALAYFIYYNLLRAAGAGNVTLTTLLVAPMAIIAGALTFGEALPPRAYAGFAILALGLLILDGRVLRLLSHRKDDAVSHR
jgi:drug/metabolite transporter (DMT)-like permease